MCAAQKSDIRKMGYMKKLKTNKKKLFVLRSESEDCPARLEYYDSDKKYKAGYAKRSIALKTCFNINKKSDAKHNFAISLYTKEDCFSIACETELEQEEWLTVLLQLQNEHITEGEEPRPVFEHIWQVTVKPRGLGNGKNLSAGPYRLCLTNKTLSLVRLSQHDPDIIFQLASVRRCGHSDCFFFMEAGSSAVTGAGELWMQVEDTVIARNVHETILRNMAGDQPFRPRSRSSVSDRRTKPISVPSNSRGASPGYDSSTLPVRSKTISGEHPGSPTAPSRLRPGKGSASGRSSTTSSLGRGHSPVPTSPIGHTLSDSQRSRTDSMESHGSHCTVSSLSADEFDLSPHDHHSSTASTRSVTPESGLARDDASYLTMTPMGSKDILVSPTTEAGPPGRGAYMEMSPSTIGSYMDMSPGENTYHEMARASFSSSPAMSTASSSMDPDEHCYLDMASIAHSLPTVQERITDAGYLDMSPGNVWNKGPILRPERVHSYLSDDQSSTDDFPRRAYSVGSKPTSVKCKGESNVAAYVDMTGNDGTLDKVNPKSSSAPHLVDKERPAGHQQREEMSRSTKELGGGRTTAYNKELLMELDFLGQGSPFRPRTSSAGREYRHRASSIEQAVARRRTGSFGKESGISRTASMGRHDRPRTSTICQDSFRTRTSSFGATDMRPRSSSHGSRSYYKGKLATTIAPSLFTSSEKGSLETDSRGSSRHSSQESLRRTLQKASEEHNPNKTSQDFYIDMLMKRTPSPSLLSTLGPSRSIDKVAAATTQKINSLWKDEYLTMTPGADTGGEPGAALTSGPQQPTQYMDMTYTSGHQQRASASTSKTPDNNFGAKSRANRGSTKSQQAHRLYLRMPSTEAKSGSTSQQSEQTQAEPVSERNTNSPGEYIDISFSKQTTTSSASVCPFSASNIMKQSSCEEENNRAVWTPETDTYALFTPGLELQMEPVGAGLEPIVCPLRLDDEDDSPNTSPNAVKTNVPSSLLSTTSKTLTGSSDDYMVLGRPEKQVKPSSIERMTSDPFALLMSPKQAQYARSTISSRSSDIFKQTDEMAQSNQINVPSSTCSITKAVPAPPSKSTTCYSSTSSSNLSNSSTYSKLGSNVTKSLSTRKSPVLPPKVRSKEKSSHSNRIIAAACVPKVVVGRTVTEPVQTSTADAIVSSSSTEENDYSVLTWGSPSVKVLDKGHSQVIAASTLLNEQCTQQPSMLPGGLVAPFAELAPLTLGVLDQKPFMTETSKTISQDSAVVQFTGAKSSERSGSTSSLSSIEPVVPSDKPLIKSRGSTSSLSSMDPVRSLSNAYTGPCVSSGTAYTSPRRDHLSPTPMATADSDNLSVSGHASHSSSRTSIASDKELNYASLDLASSHDESTFPTTSELENSEENSPLSYAKIDFAKSEERR